MNSNEHGNKAWFAARQDLMKRQIIRPGEGRRPEAAGVPEYRYIRICQPGGKLSLKRGDGARQRP